MTDTYRADSEPADLDPDAIVELRARMPHPAFLLDGGMNALTAMNRVSTSTGITPAILHLVTLRASQINGCAWCTVEHTRELREVDGAGNDRIAAVASWRDAPYFTPRERAALALTEALTRLADRPDAVPDDLWGEVSAVFSDREIGGLLFTIGTINVWNRINAAIRQPAGRV